MPYLPCVEDVLCFEYLDHKNQRAWSIGTIKEFSKGVCNVTEWIDEQWGPGSYTAVRAEIDSTLKAISECNSCISKEGESPKKNLLEELIHLEKLNRRLDSLEVIYKLLLESKFSAIKGKFFRRSHGIRHLCLSNIIEKISGSSACNYTIIIEEDAQRFASSFCKLEVEERTSKLKELKFFDSRWSWDPRWPTIVTKHSAFFSWKGFDLILRSKPEEVHNVFVAEAAFCIQVPIQNIIDTHFCAVKDELLVTFKVIHHPSVHPAEIDVRISQHPFWSMLYIRDSELDDRKGLDKAAGYFRRLLGLSENSNNAMYFLQFLETLPKNNFSTGKNVYESELLEMLTFCERLHEENAALRDSLFKNEFGKSSNIWQTARESVDLLPFKTSEAKKELSRSKTVTLDKNADATERKLSTTSEYMGECEASGNAYDEVVAFLEKELLQADNEVTRKNEEISDLLKRMEEMSEMLEEALDEKEEDFRHRVQLDDEIFHLQQTIDTRENTFV